MIFNEYELINERSRVTLTIFDEHELTHELGRILWMTYIFPI